MKKIQDKVMELNLKFNFRYDAYLYMHLGYKLSSRFLNLLYRQSYLSRDTLSHLLVVEGCHNDGFSHGNLFHSWLNIACKKSTHPSFHDRRLILLLEREKAISITMINDENKYD